MDIAKEKTIGIVGGMGPQAGADLLGHITRLTKAAKDQDHHSVILMSYPSVIPDRTGYMEGEEDENPAYIIAGILRRLDTAGAGVAGLACNSAHIPEIFEVVKEELQHHGSSIQLLHMPDETCRYISQSMPEVKKVGILSTTGTYKANLYPERLEAAGLTPIVPDADFQRDIIHRMVYDPQYGIKSHASGISGQVKQWLETALDYFQQRGADALILGCTEFCFVLTEPEVRGIKIVNSSEALARALIREVEK